jgi:hypothetical protein
MDADEGFSQSAGQIRTRLCTLWCQVPFRVGSEMTVGPAARSRTDDDSAWMGWIDDSVIVTECDPLRYLAPTCGMVPTSIVISIN